MKEEIQNAVNAWYESWLLCNDPFEEDFESELLDRLPDLKFTLLPNQNKWILL